jgi:hypothetical protein
MACRFNPYQFTELTLHPPNAGETTRYVANWQGHLEEIPINLLSLENGSILWHSSWGAIGFPVWSNGQVFLSVKWDLSPRAIRCFKAHGEKIPVWLEERSIANRSVLWRTLLPGNPPEKVRVTALGGRRLEVQFTGGYKDKWLDFLRPLKFCRVVVPLRKGPRPRASDPQTVRASSQPLGFPTNS